MRLTFLLCLSLTLVACSKPTVSSEIRDASTKTNTKPQIPNSKGLPPEIDSSAVGTYWQGGWTPSYIHLNLDGTFEFERRLGGCVGPMKSAFLYGSYRKGRTKGSFNIFPETVKVVAYNLERDSTQLHEIVRTPYDSIIGSFALLSPFFSDVLNHKTYYLFEWGNQSYLGNQPAIRGFQDVLKEPTRWQGSLTFNFHEKEGAEKAYKEGSKEELEALFLPSTLSSDHRAKIFDPEPWE